LAFLFLFKEMSFLRCLANAMPVPAESVRMAVFGGGVISGAEAPSRRAALVEGNNPALMQTRMTDMVKLLRRDTSRLDKSGP
jgi:hypothetical protein